MKLRASQLLARDFLRNVGRAALWSDCGFGKTATVLAALTDDHLPALVVAPARPAHLVWPGENARWRPDLDLTLATGSPDQRAALLRQRSPVTVISQNSLVDAVGLPWRTVILDESSGYKDRGTARWKAAKKLAAKADNVWEMTGTPSPNGLMDLWAQVLLLDAGERLGKTLTGFRSRYFREGARTKAGQVYEWLPYDTTEARIHELLQDVCLNMEEDLDLPPVTHNTVEVRLPPTVRSHYKEFADELVLNLELLGGEIHSAANAAVLTNKLAQITAGFVFSDEGTHAHDWLHNENVNAVREIVDGTGSPVVVFYQFRPQLAALRSAFPEAVTVNELRDMNDWDAGRIPVLLAHPQSAAHGLNLQYGSHTIIWASPTWNLEHWLQGNKRVNRPGQTKPVMIHVIAARGTVDYLMLDRLAGKEVTLAALLDALASPL